MLLKKSNSAWRPAENPSLKLGEVIEISDYATLVRQGLAIIVDEAGNEMPLPGETLTCPICFKKLVGKLSEFTAHVADAHSPKVEEEIVSEQPATDSEESQELTTQEKRIEALKKARAAKKSGEVVI